MDLLKIANQQGQHMKEKEKENRKRVSDWMKLNGFNVTMKKCQEDLGLSHVTVRKHMRELGVK